MPQILQFLDFDARSDHVQFNHGNEVVKNLTTVRSVNETIENTLPKNNISSTNEGMKARRHIFDNKIFSEMHQIYKNSEVHVLLLDLFSESRVIHGLSLEL
jgi:hypothetical protein